MMQLCGPVVQDQARADDLACLCWSDTQLVMETVPPALDDPNASFNGASCAAVCCVVRHLLLILRVEDWR